jgi:hypothetical protein
LIVTFPVTTGNPVGPFVALSCAASVILHPVGSVIVAPEVLAVWIADFRADTVHGVSRTAPAAPLAALAALAVSRLPGTAAPRTAAAAIFRVRLVPLLEVTNSPRTFLCGTVGTPLGPPTITASQTIAT